MTSGKGLQVLPTIVIEQHELLSLYEMSYFCWKRVEFVSLFAGAMAQQLEPTGLIFHEPHTGA